MDLRDYVVSHTVRGACMCGKCIDAPPQPEQRQPDGHTADMVFFKIAQREDPTIEEFVGLVKARYPHWLDGEEHNYIEMGADIGDQGLALQTMGLGSLLGAWNLITPKMLGLSDESLVRQMAGMGFIIVQKGEDNDTD
jgi:hypothetical protein